MDDLPKPTFTPTAAPPPTGPGETPAEMKFWAEQADKAPALVRTAASGVEAPHVSTAPRIVGVSLGAILTVASLTKYVPGKWKILSGSAAAVSAGAGLLLGSAIDKANAANETAARTASQGMENYANRLEQDGALRQQFARYLGDNVTGADLQAQPLEQVIANKAVEFGQSQTPLFKQAAGGRQI